MITIKDSILNLSKAIRTPVLPEVKQIIDSIDPDYDGVEPYKTDIKEWLSPIINLTNYRVYPMNGITQGLDWWYHQETRSVYMDEGDYIEMNRSNGSIHINPALCSYGIALIG